MGRIDTPAIDTSEQTTSEPATRPQTRKCLMCGDKFSSTGTHNRICKRCKSTQAWREGRDSE